MMTTKPDGGGYTGSGDAHSVGQMLWRLFFLCELAVAAVVVFGAWMLVFRGGLEDFWPGAMFCYSVVLAIILDTVLKHYVLHRKPLFSPLFAVFVSLIFLSAGIGLCWLMAH
jgi:hypothetical protein